MRGRVLVVDDDVALAEMLGIVLRGEGFDPVFCADGGEAVQAFRDSRPDIILLDLMLPGMDGLEILRRMRGEGRKACVLILTAKDTVQDRVAGLDLGADDYLVKPFASSNVVDVYIGYLRKKLGRGDRPAPIRTVRGRGYVLGDGS